MQRVQLTVNGGPKGGLQDSFGRLIDGDRNGQPGGNAVAILGKTGVVLEPGASASTTHGPALHASSVDAVLATSKITRSSHGKIFM
jgi:hypothetical protein